MEQHAALNNAVFILKIVVLIYIIASPVILHDSTSVFNTDIFHLAAVVVSAGFILVDRTLGVLMLVASAIMIGSFNYHAEKQSQLRSVPAMVELGIVPNVAPVPEPESILEVHRAPSGPVRQVVESMEIPSEYKEVKDKEVKDKEKYDGCYTLGAKEVHAPLDFLSSPGLNPNGFVTAESLAKIQTNTVAEGSLDNVYSPLGAGVYTAQGVLPGVDISAP